MHLYHYLYLLIREKKQQLQCSLANDMFAKVKTAHQNQRTTCD